MLRCVWNHTSYAVLAQRLNDVVICLHRNYQHVVYCFMRPYRVSLCCSCGCVWLYSIVLLPHMLCTTCLYLPLECISHEIYYSMLSDPYSRCCSEHAHVTIFASCIAVFPAPTVSYCMLMVGCMVCHHTGPCRSSTAVPSVAQCAERSSHATHCPRNAAITCSCAMRVSGAGVCGASSRTAVTQQCRQHVAATARDCHHHHDHLHCGV